MRTTFLGIKKPSWLQGEKKRQEKKRGKKFKVRMLHQQQQKQRMDTHTHTAKECDDTPKSVHPCKQRNKMKASNRHNKDRITNSLESKWQEKKTETTTKGKQVERNEPHQADTASSPPPPPHHHHPNCYCYCYRYREDDNKLLKPGDYRSLIASKNSTIQHKLIRAILSHVHTRGQGKQEVDEEFDESIWPLADD